MSGYKPPVSRNQFASIRGVNVDAVIRTLQQRGYVDEVARDPGPGQAVLYGTTPTFLERLGIDSVEDLPPPPEEAATDISSAPTFTPFTVAPSIQNRAEVVRAMEREYPPLLRDAGIGGRAVVFFFIDEGGIVQDFRISETSGHQALDDAALAVADVYRFSAALNRDKKVPVWVQFPITFQVR